MQNKEEFTEKDYLKILNSVKYNIFDEVKLFLKDKRDAFEECILFYLDENSNIDNKTNRLFDWLKSKAEELKESEKYSNFIKAVEKNIFNLAKISMPHFFELSKKIFWDKKLKIIEELSKDANVQLIYLDLLIESMVKIDSEGDNAANEDEEQELLKNLLGKQIFLLCELKKFDEIVPKLKSNSYYPLEKCLNYCIDSGAYEGCLYLYLRMTSTDSAYNLAKTKMDGIFTSLTRNISANNDIEEQKKLLILFEKYLNDLKYICENEKKKDSAEELWLKVLDQLYRFENTIEQSLKKYDSNLEKKNSLEQLLQIIIQDIKDLMEKMCSYVSIKRIMEQVAEKNKNAGFKEFRELLIKILNNYDNLSNIFKSARSLLTNLVLESEGSFQVLNAKGELLNVTKCDKCGKNFVKNLNSTTQENIIMFLCDHIFHKFCIEDISGYRGGDPVCPICTDLEFIKTDNKANTLIKSNATVFDDKKDENNQIQVNVSQNSKKMLKQLKKFDDNYFEKRKILTDFIDD